REDRDAPDRTPPHHRGHGRAAAIANGMIRLSGTNAQARISPVLLVALMVRVLPGVARLALVFRMGRLALFRVGAGGGAGVLAARRTLAAAVFRRHRRYLGHDVLLSFKSLTGERCVASDVPSAIWRGRWRPRSWILPGPAPRSPEP